MKVTFAHNNINVLNLERSIAFYREALGFHEDHRMEIPNATLVYLQDEAKTPHLLELTWLKDRKEPYNLGENEIHLAVTTDDFDAAHEKHKAMGCICYENLPLGVYFIVDPDGYWTEILPA